LYVEKNMFEKKSIKDLNVKNKKVFVRVDFNVPIQEGRVTDDTRIKAALPTINYLREHGAAIILASHLGRPGGIKNEEFSLKPVADYLKNIYKDHFIFSNDCIGPKTDRYTEALKPGDVLLLENTRFYAGEEKNDPKLGKIFASYADVFVNDAFGMAHRAHASNVGVAGHLPSGAGLLILKELEFLGRVIEDPDRPFTAILGGAKVSGKIGVINNLVNKVDYILIGGGMANTFFAAQGYKMGESLVEYDSLKIATEILSKAKDKILLPIDFVIADDFTNDASSRTIEIGDVPQGWRVMDLGMTSIAKYKEIIDQSKTIVWNGPMGVFEFPVFAKGTFKLAELIAKSDAISIVGGGDSAAAINQAGLSEDISHISTGGGASLKMLEGAILPGLEALDDK
jgi:phosphoglycerate kinase